MRGPRLVAVSACTKATCFHEIAISDGAHPIDGSSSRPILGSNAISEGPSMRKYVEQPGGRGQPVVSGIHDVTRLSLVSGG